MRNIGNFQPLHQKSTYSEKEIKMLLHFVDRNLLDQTEPLTVYRVAVSKAFTDNIVGPAADSLRRTFIAFNDNSRTSICRNSREWDELINFGE